MDDWVCVGYGDIGYMIGCAWGMGIYDIWLCVWGMGI